VVFCFRSELCYAFILIRNNLSSHHC